MKRLYDTKNQKYARNLRRKSTETENLLWSYLRNKQIGGFKFRRQQPIGKYIVDFACMQAKLVIELDGGGHAEQESYDRKRDNFIRNAGYRVLRFWNHDVWQDVFSVLEKIYFELNTSPPTSSAAGKNPCLTDSPSRGE